MANWIVFAVELLRHDFISCLLVECPSFFPHFLSSVRWLLLVHLYIFICSFILRANKLKSALFMIFVNEKFTQNLLIVFLLLFIVAVVFLLLFYLSFFSVRNVSTWISTWRKNGKRKNEKIMKQKIDDDQIGIFSKFYLYPKQEITHGLIFESQKCANLSSASSTLNNKKNIWIEMNKKNQAAVSMNFLPTYNNKRKKSSNKIYCAKNLHFLNNFV